MAAPTTTYRGDGGHGADQPPLDPPPDFASITAGAEIVVPVSLVDKSGTEVVHADTPVGVPPAALAVRLSH
jgi:hypothetical protein